MVDEAGPAGLRKAPRETPREASREASRGTPREASREASREAQGNPPEAESPNFRIQPQAVGAYAEVLRGQALRLARIEAELGSTPIDPAWLGSLPEAGRLTREITSWRETELGQMAEVARALAVTGEQLAGNIATYTKADGVVAEAFGRIGGVGRRGW
jgi:hypothetical protein